MGKMAPVSKQGTLSRDYILHARKRGKTRDRAAYYSIICGICFVAVLQTLVHSSVAAAPIPNTQNLFNSSVQTESRRHIHQSVGKIFVAKLTPDVDFLLWIFQRYLPVYDHLDKGCTYFLFGEFGNRWQPVWRYIPKFAIQERSTLPLTGRQRTNVQFDNDTRIFSNSTISDISVVYPSSHLLGFLVVIFPRLTHAHIGHFVRLSRYFYVQVGNVFSPIGLVFGLNSQFVGINRAGSYLQPYCKAMNMPVRIVTANPYLVKRTVVRSNAVMRSSTSLNCCTVTGWLVGGGFTGGVTGVGAGFAGTPTFSSGVRSPFMVLLCCCILYFGSKVLVFQVWRVNQLEHRIAKKEVILAIAKTEAHFIEIGWVT
jgi:hypothetical protein